MTDTELKDSLDNKIKRHTAWWQHQADRLKLSSGFNSFYQAAQLYEIELDFEDLVVPYIEHLEKALKAISEHPHCNQGMACVGYENGYATAASGARTGHRCASDIARRALEGK